MGLRRIMLDTRFRSVTSATHGGLVAAELAAMGAVDRLMPRDGRAASQLTKVTALVKTFERPEILRRLTESIHRVYPDLRVLVVDDSREPSRLPGVQTVTMPYDSGIGAGRNEALRHATTPYVLVLDDDFIFYRGTGLGPALRIMKSRREIDIMGGQLLDLPLLRRREPPRGEIFDTGAQPRHPLGSTVGGLEVVDKVSQFFLARRERIQLVGWDDGLKRADHADFFSRALGVLTTVFNPELRCLHARTPFDDAYMAKRMDLEESLRRLDERYRG
jgi:Glycosyl transferase family 2